MCATSVNVAVLPFGNVRIVHVVVGPGLPQLNVGPLFCVKLTNVKGDDGGIEFGSVSVNDPFVASFGPSLTSVMVWVTSVSAGWLTGPVFWMRTSARLPPDTLVPVMAVLFSSLSSGVSEETGGVLISVVPAALWETFTTMSNCAVLTAPGESKALLQFTVPPASPTFGVVQMKVGPVVCVSETNVASAGSVSVMLPTVTVKVMFVPTLAVPGALLVTNRSADCAAAETATRNVKAATHTARIA